MRIAPAYGRQGLRNSELKKILEGLPIGPDIMIRDFDLTEDF
jgi:hypothetical protein